MLTVVVLVYQLKDPVADLTGRHADVTGRLEFDLVDDLHHTQKHKSIELTSVYPAPSLLVVYLFSDIFLFVALPRSTSVVSTKS